MSKSVLIIDTPTNCFECPCFMEIGWRCQCRLDIDEEVHGGRPDWCPLAKESSTEAIPVEWLMKVAENSYTPIIYDIINMWRNNETS